MPLRDGTRMPLVEFGDPAGAPVIVLPGLTDGVAPVSERRARAAMAPPPRELRDHRVLVISYRHPLGEDVTTEALSTDVAHVVEQEVARPVVVSGHSMGAMVAQHLAATRPDLVGAVVLSAAVAHADASLRAELDRWDAHVRRGEWRAFLRSALDASYTGAELLRRRVVLRLSPVPDLAPLRGRHLALSSACRRHDARDRLGSIQVPTLVLGATRDPVTGIDGVRELAAAVPGAELVEFDGLAHGFPEQAEDRYVRELTAFLGRRTGERGQEATSA